MYKNGPKPLSIAKKSYQVTYFWGPGNIILTCFLSCLMLLRPHTVIYSGGAELDGYWALWGCLILPLLLNRQHPKTKLRQPVFCVLYLGKSSGLYPLIRGSNSLNCRYLGAQVVGALRTSEGVQIDNQGHESFSSSTHMSSINIPAALSEPYLFEFLLIHAPCSNRELRNTKDTPETRFFEGKRLPGYLRISNNQGP